MSALAIAAPAHVGRPSNAELTLRCHVLAAEVARLEQDRSDLVAEIAAYAIERAAAAADLLLAARRGQAHVAAGARPTMQLLEVERIALREQHRALSMGLADDGTDDEPAAAA
jgi:hypothetical protein